MEKIKLNELLGCSIKKICSGSELMLLYELDKYSKELLNKEVDFSGIQIIKELHNNEYYSYVYAKGLDFNYIPLAEELVDITEVSRKFFTADLTGIVFEKKTAKEWVYDYNTNRTANLILNKYNRSGGYVSLYAYMVVLSYRDGKKTPKLILQNTSPKQEEMEYVDILILKNFGNCLLKNKVEIIYSKEVVIQPEWEAYITYNRQLGYMNREIKLNEKLKYISKNFQVGDVVLYYKTEKAIKSKSIRKLLHCYPAVIRNITKTNIYLDYYPDITTKLTHKRNLEQAEEICGNSYKYTPDDYNRFPVCRLNLDILNTGFDLLVYLEDEFLLTPQNGVDSFEQYLVNAEGVESIYILDTLNTIYAVFEDRGIKYNKEKFLEKFFKKQKPVYDTIVGNSK